MTNNVSKKLLVLAAAALIFSSCGEKTKKYYFTQNANSSSGSYWEYELSTETVIKATEYSESKFPLNSGGGYSQHWTFEFIGEGEVTIHWLAYEGDDYSEKASYSTTYIFDNDGHYTIE